MRRRAVIPHVEKQTLAMSVFEANDMAEAGDTLDGWRCLLGCMERAEEAREFEEPWAEELISRYRQALDEYAAKHGIKPE